MIITSALDQDTYKFTQQQAVLHQHPGAMVGYLFKCRTPGIDFRPYFGEIIKNVNRMCNEVVFTKEDLDYLGSLRFLKKDYIDFLRIFRFNYDYLNMTCDNKGRMHIRVEGPWLHTILFEIPILSIVSEVYSREMSLDFKSANTRTLEKMELISINEPKIQFADFGGRRRHSKQAQENAIALAIKSVPKQFVGTSNVMFAKQFGVKAIGTMAHEWLQAHQALYRIAESQVMAFDHWAREYRGDLGIALSDVIGLKYFLYDFDMYFSKLFDGTRQDSGDPYEYGEAMIDHYKKMNIDPMTKTIVFSDGLNFSKAIEIANRFNGRIKLSFGIGTNFTNDFDFKALQIVLKMITCNGQPVAKLSDTPEKGMCMDESYVDYLKTVFNRRISG